MSGGACRLAAAALKPLLVMVRDRCWTESGVGLRAVLATVEEVLTDTCNEVA